jgi:hypothetical protein
MATGRLQRLYQTKPGFTPQHCHIHVWYEQGSELVATAGKRRIEAVKRWPTSEAVLSDCK